MHQPNILLKKYLILYRPRADYWSWSKPVVFVGLTYAHSSGVIAKFTYPGLSDMRFVASSLKPA
jgi:hypothetical protein